MKTNSRIFLICLFFMIIISIGCVSAEDIDDTVLADDTVLTEDTVLADNALSAGDTDNMETIDQGTVSGGVDVATSSPWATSGEFNYTLPAGADVKSANLYANVYSGSAQPTHGAHANIKINDENFASEDLISTEGTTDGIIYIINDHTTKVYSDYEMHYDITDTVKSLSGSTLKFNIDTSAIEGKTFDGRIKWFALIVAYDDGDSDVINYWINAGQTYSTDTLITSFSTSTIDSKYKKALLRNVILSGADATYRFNDEVLIGDAIDSNSYYKYHEWDVSKFYKAGQDSIVNYAAGQGSYGKSIKNVLAVLTLEEYPVDVASIKAEYNSASQGNVIYPGVENTITASISAVNDGDYTVVLYADGVAVANTTASLTSTASNVLLVDPTIRAMDDSTWFNGDNNAKVNYAVEVYDGDVLVGSADTTAKVRFNGYFAKDVSPDMSDVPFDFSTLINGDVLISNGDSAYVSGAKNTTAVIPLALPADSAFVGGLLYLAYCYDSTGNDFLTFDNLTFNDVDISSKLVGKYRDQPNLGSASRYGLLIYDVSDLIKGGDNILYTGRSAAGAVYPATLIGFYNTTGSDSLKKVVMLNGADVLTYSSYNTPKRPVNVTTSLDVDINPKSVMWYVFASGAQAGRGDLVFNDQVFSNVWSGDSYSSDMVNFDVSDLIQTKNTMSFVATGGIITALQQMFVMEYPSASIESIKAEYYSGTQGNVVYPGVENTITASISAEKDGDYTVVLYVDGVAVANTTASLTSTASNVLLVDPAIRAMDDSTWYRGDDNDNVTYAVEVYDGDVLVGSADTTAKVRFNGYFAKDVSPDMSDVPFDFNALITGGVLISNGNSTYASAAKNLTAIIPLALPADSAFVGGLLYLAYCYDSTGNDFLTFDNLTFNDVDISSKLVGKYRDQPNLGSASRYGLLIYDVSDLIKDGDNILYTERSAAGAVYPATLIGFYNTTGAETLKQVTILNGADVLSYSYNTANRPVNATSTFNFNQNVIKADWYVFASGAQAGRGDLVFNDQVFSNVWSGNSYSSDMVNFDVTDLIQTKNTMSFVATGGIITALQQMFVVEYISNDAISVARPQGSTQVNIKASLPSDATGTVVVYIDGKKSLEPQLANGSFNVKTSELSSGSHKISVVYSGDSKYPAINKTVTINVPKPVLKGKNIYMNYTAGTKYAVRVTLDGKAVAGKYVKITFNGKTKSVKTNSKGYAYFTIPNTAKPKTAKYTITASYNGVKISNKVRIYSIVKAKNLKVKKSAKKLTIKVTLKKVNKKYLKGKKITLKFRGKTYKAKTNSKGVATFKISKTVLKKLKAGKKYSYKASYSKDVVTKKITVKR